jgi:hypothetical protein
MPFLQFLKKEKKEDKMPTGADMNLPPPPPSLKGNQVFSDLPVFPNQKDEPLPSALDDLDTFPFKFDNTPPSMPAAEPAAPEVSAPPEQKPVLEPTEAAVPEQAVDVQRNVCFVPTSTLATIQEHVDSVVGKWPKRLPEELEATRQAEYAKIADIHNDLEIARKRLAAADIILFEQGETS